ncbi:hypothetical protein BOTBODRAFT_175153 [Botryobasidium botryosum FD-172 SS1]|uniref:Uncharacterized protein n=1 Tax=Botryobasidium botryosum (strain FD-172 SS1) TaxID=930990 RepID=A0A067MH38_BOTB1|nr:hypothetical protein BOTBODRAFT_175153 [Botryobasidium botryosum FD-172 SS1]
MVLSLSAITLVVSVLVVDVAAVLLVDLDDRATPPIIYTGTWTQTNDLLINGANSNFWDGTTTNTITPGDTASLTFTGVQISYWADKDVDNANINVNLDGQITPVSVYNSVFISQQLLFSATNLANTTHTFTITHVGTQGEYMNVDHIQYGYLPPPPPPPPTTTLTPSTPPPAAVPSLTTDPERPNTTNNVQGVMTAKSSNDVAIIVGCVAGAVIISLLSVSAVLFKRYRARQGRRSEAEAAVSGGGWLVNPGQSAPGSDAQPAQSDTAYLDYSNPYSVPRAPDLAVAPGTISPIGSRNTASASNPSTSMYTQPIMNAPYGSPNRSYSPGSHSPSLSPQSMRPTEYSGPSGSTSLRGSGNAFAPKPLPAIPQASGSNNPFHDLPPGAMPRFMSPPPGYPVFPEKQF